MPQLDERHRATYDIFEGTEQIQQLVISRAISWLADRVVLAVLPVGLSAGWLSF